MVGSRQAIGLVQDGSTKQRLMIFCTRIRETDQIFAHIENKAADMESAMTFRRGVSGNLGGNAQRSRHALNADTIREMHLAFRRGGRKAIEKVMRNNPAVFLKLLVLLVPREMKLEHSGGIKAMTTEQIERSIEFIKEIFSIASTRPVGVNIW